VCLEELTVTLAAASLQWIGYLPAALHACVVTQCEQLQLLDLRACVPSRRPSLPVAQRRLAADQLRARLRRLMVSWTLLAFAYRRASAMMQALGVRGCRARSRFSCLSAATWYILSTSGTNWTRLPSRLRTLPRLITKVTELQKERTPQLQAVALSVISSSLQVHFFESGYGALISKTQVPTRQVAAVTTPVCTAVGEVRSAVAPWCVAIS
jgi:hypothetical protein